MNLLTIQIVADAHTTTSRHRGYADEAIRAAVRKRFGRTATFNETMEPLHFLNGTSWYHGKVERKRGEPTRIRIEVVP